MTANDLFRIIGKEVTSAEVCEVIQFYALTEVMDAPPYERYICSRSNGIELLLENERVIAVQIFVEAAQGFLAFPYELPMGLMRHMSQEDVHQLLGDPIEYDNFDSKYKITEQGDRIVIVFDKLSKIRYLEIGAPIPLL